MLGFLPFAYFLAGSELQIGGASSTVMLIHNEYKPLVPLLLTDDGRGLRVLMVAGSTSLINLLEDNEPDRKAAGNPSGRDLAQLFGGP